MHHSEQSLPSIVKSFSNTSLGKSPSFLSLKTKIYQKIYYDNLTDEKKKYKKWNVKLILLYC